MQDSINCAGRGQEWTASPAGQGFMSAQRREHRSTQAAVRRCRVARRRSQRTSNSPSAGPSVPFAQAACAVAGGTAPPEGQIWFHPSNMEPSLGTPGRLATKSLQSDHRKGKRPFAVRLNASPGLPLLEARRFFGTPESPRFSPPPIELSSAPSRFHPALPEIPAGISCWAERHDGKRDMHFQHAA
jgi:hypothetical protein